MPDTSTELTRYSDKSALGAFDMSTAASDTVDLARPARAFYVGSIAGGAAAKITTLAGTTVTLAGLVAGTIYPISVKRLWSTGTSATAIIGLY
jgi:hypothetical protein